MLAGKAAGARTLWGGAAKNSRRQTVAFCVGGWYTIRKKNTGLIFPVQYDHDRAEALGGERFGSANGDPRCFLRSKKQLPCSAK